MAPASEPSPTGYDGVIYGGPTPALTLVVGAGWVEGISLDADGSPLECTACPFSSRSIEPYEHIANDVSEAHYLCALLEKVVWGEYAPCSLADWQRKAREEMPDAG